MGLFSRKKKEQAPPPHPTFARLLNIVIVLAVVWMIAQNFREGAQPGLPAAPHPDAPLRDVSGETLLRSHYLEAARVGAMELLTRNGKQELVHETNLSPNGASLACGQTVQYRLQILTYPDRKPDPGFKDINAKKQTLRLGAAQGALPQLLHLLASDLNIGGSSRYVFPRNVVLKAFRPDVPVAEDAEAGRPVILQFEALSATPPTPKSEMPSTILETRTGTEPRLRCGGIALLRLRAWTLDGQPATIQLPDEQQFAADSPERNASPQGGKNFFLAQIGAGRLPFGIERAAEGMTLDSTRNAILPPAYLAPFPATSKEGAPLSFVPSDQALWVEITRVSPETLAEQNRAKMAADPQASAPANPAREEPVSPASAAATPATEGPVEATQPHASDAEAAMDRNASDAKNIANPSFTPSKP